MNNSVENPIITTNNTVDQKTGNTCRVEINSTNGLTYIVQNLPSSKSRSNLSLQFNGDVVFNGSLNDSNYRADSFPDCESHHIFKLSKQEVQDFLDAHKDSLLGTIFMDYLYNGRANRKEYSCIWINRKMNIIYKEKTLNINLKKLTDKYKSKTVLKNFVITNTTAVELDYASSLDNKIEVITIRKNDDTKEASFVAVYNKETKECKFMKHSNIIKKIEEVNQSQFNKLLKDEVMHWSINHAKGKFKTFINDYGFTEEMTYNQVFKLKKMIEI